MKGSATSAVAMSDCSSRSRSASTAAVTMAPWSKANAGPSVEPTASTAHHRPLASAPPDGGTACLASASCAADTTRRRGSRVGRSNTPNCSSRLGTSTIPVRAITARRAASSSVSSCSTTAPGSAHRPIAGSRWRSTSSTTRVASETANKATSTARTTSDRSSGVRPPGPSRSLFCPLDPFFLADFFDLPRDGS